MTKIRYKTLNNIIFRQSAISLDLHNTQKQFVASWALQYKQNVTITFTIKSRTLTYKLRYVAGETFVRRDGNIVTHGYGSNLEEGQWKHFTRNLVHDLQKGISKKALQQFKGTVTKPFPVSVTKVAFQGVGCVTNLSLANQEHMRQFFSGADWILKNQDVNGGWPVDVIFNKDKTKYPKAGEIEPGWYSAMAQGHALSVLSRAYSASRDLNYLMAGFKALDLFGISSEQGGFVAKFLGKYVWYEEYPTNPSTFVLNGFMYSLVGLYDLKEVLEEHDLTKYEQYSTVTSLFKQGMESLKALLPLFDASSGSVYDLRHFTMKTEPKVARWDYHSTHINLLYILSTLDSDPVLTETAERWRGYMVGKRAEHN